jgi:serine/threonine protein kinase
VNGSGSFLTVFKGYRKSDLLGVAIKMISKNASPAESRHLENEQEIIKSLNHPNICKFYDTFETDTKRYIVTELAEGGTLFDLLNERGPLAEIEAKRLFTQLFSAISYLHQDAFIMHRDLKLENVLLDRGKSHIKLIDFGYATPFSNGCKFARRIGSPAYCAPEVAIGNEYNESIDIWGLGVMLYAMTVGRLPFQGHSSETLLQNVIVLNPVYHKHLSKDLKELLNGLLEKGPLKRISLDGIAAHQWMVVNSLRRKSGGFLLDQGEAIKVVH